MQKLIIRFGVLGGLLALTYWGVLQLVYTNMIPKYSYVNAINDKFSLLEQTPSPRLLFVGGSNLAFGLDSPRIELALGLPVVNLGLHGGVGLRFMLNSVKPHLRAQDIVIVIPEYQLFTGMLDGESTLLDVLYIFPKGRSYIHSRGQYWVILKSMPVSIQEIVKGMMLGLIVREDPIYRRSGFNTNGDVVSHLTAPSQDISKLPMFATHASLDPEAFDVLDAFVVDARKTGAQVYVMFPNISDVHYRTNQALLHQIRDRLNQSMVLTVVGTQEDYIFPPDFFFDTVYHLNAQGRAARTEKVIADLSPALSRSGLAPR